jgi:hypothetical protein
MVINPYSPLNPLFRTKKLEKYFSECSFFNPSRSLSKVEVFYPRLVEKFGVKMESPSFDTLNLR